MVSAACRIVYRYRAGHWRGVSSISPHLFLSANLNLPYNLNLTYNLTLTKPNPN